MRTAAVGATSMIAWRLEFLGAAALPDFAVSSMSASALRVSHDAAARFRLPSRVGGVTIAPMVSGCRFRSHTISEQSTVDSAANTPPRVSNMPAIYRRWRSVASSVAPDFDGRVFGIFGADASTA